jgi:uncharacterized protein
MVTLDTIRKDMVTQLETDRELRNVEIRADSLDEALSDAAVQLNTRVANLEYEIVERGFDGFLGLSKKPWTIKVYQNAETALKLHKAKKDELFSDDDLEEQAKIIDRDGVFYIRHFGSKLCLKVVLPEGKGKTISYNDIISAVRHPDVTSLNESVIKKCVGSGSDGTYQEIGEYTHIPANDALLVIDISKDEMKATATVSAPGSGGADISADMIQQALKTQGVVAGFSDDKVNAFVDSPVYNIPAIVAEGISAVDGRDAYIAYNFETDRSKIRAKEAANGQMNFKELNLVQNVVAGQPLAQKMLAEHGKAGKTLFGKYLEAKNGKDIPMPLGKNVEVDSDGRTIVAKINGQVLLVGDKINVEPVMEVDGVNIKTGNITFLGTLVCKGNVEDGFDVKASGNIEIYGTVGKSHLESDGDIIVSQGIMGRDEGSISAGKSIWAKFIQNTKAQAGEYIVVSDSIMNSDVSAQKKIILQGKRAQITGGHLFATEEIAAKNIGSNGGGAETILEVGFDPKAKHRLEELQSMESNNVKELDELELNIATLENQKKIRRTLPKDKEDNLAKFNERKEEIIAENDKMTGEITTIQQHLRELKVVGRVLASGTVYAGVKIYVRDEKDEVRTDVRSVTFYYENGFVRRGKYEAPVDTDIKAPDGYSSN